METTIKLNEKVPNYVILNPDVSMKNYKDYLLLSYEGGCLLVFENFAPQTLLDWLWENTRVTVDGLYKKVKSKVLLDQNLDHEHPLWAFTDKPNTMQVWIKRLYHQVKQYTKATFPEYKIAGENWTWRFTETREDEMHLDSYADQNNDLHNLRIFVNLDNKARIWRTSYHVLDILEYYKGKSLYVPGKHPNELNNILNAYLACDKLPYHEIEFAPGSMWMVNSQLICHQGWYGNRMAAFTFRISPESMYNPELNFVNQVMNKLEEMNGLKKC